MTADLAGRRALVTGGAGGIGGAVAVALARAGADVALTYLSHDPAPVVAQIEALGRRASAHQLDARHSWDVDAAVAAAADALGGLDVLVNNVGGLVDRRPVARTDDAHWHHVMDLNLSSVFYVTRAALGLLPDGGRIVTISSQAAASGGGSGGVPYATAKAAVEGFTRGLARELGPRRITVNAVAPGFVGGTPFHAAHTPEPAQRAAVAATPLGRAGEPEDVAAAVVHLASDGAAFVTGVVLDVNGGAWFR
ncbi:SDR family NAD(P)-dependent oxidoreductase [Cellulomonas phragmiteti]|uniref:3-oxoacyl-ACP reductase n=1 Tax=Cellulomonas phragmiteti TaxID=478780 RepID=A0ABQ4DN91_9CELL|nr:SDR family oxidoreductase [Cellulomonas phragmiteti]GIG40830.1 3-oxoacyl-ACP reductase [Cellulomonas phragmiteti]